MTLATSIGVHPISPTIGAEISGVDLSVPLAPEMVAAIRDAWTTHHVIFFRDQSLTADQQADFARQFGTVTEAHPVLPSIEESPEVLAIDGRVDRASWWHTDVTFLQTPAMGSILYMLEAPEVGGDTMWASLQDAYDGLAEPVRTMCDTLIAIHHDPWFAADVAERGGLRVGRRVAREAAAGPAPGRADAPGERSQRPVREPPVHPAALGTVGQREQRHPRDALSPLHASPSTPAASAGGPVRWRSGTTGPPCTTPSTTTATPAAYAHRVTLRGDKPYGPAMPLPRLLSAAWPPTPGSPRSPSSAPISTTPW